jgi:hypothetical protein
MPIATVSIKGFNDVLVAETRLVCPKCGVEPKYHGGYDCEKCGSHYNHWSNLKRILPNGQEVVKPKLNTAEGVEADAYVMDIMDFGKHADATLKEYGIIVKDESSAKNIRKLLIAMRNLGKVIVLHFNDTYEERIAVLTTSISNRIILKELVPENLADIDETMRVSLENLTDKDVQEAETFVKQFLPKADENLFYAHDYRTVGLEVEKVSPHVLELEAIINQQQQPEAQTATVQK